ncbi:hypothetical protein ACFVFS_09635 [Kitasatospora sp. NPDC057692]|uniref:hypothetical protein n=1 Tax=Kitasatospora sp. NPDC057692 TaxID=3346215 RepID=UPI0036C30D94
MTLSEDTGQDAPHTHDRYRTRHGRHGRPGPFGGRLRLPTLRFSGAAMAMSTVVGISIATTFLLNEQQGVGRRAGVARVGSSGPPTPSTSPGAAATGSGTTSGTGTAAGPDTVGPDTATGRHPAGPAASGTRAPDAVPGQRTAGPSAPRSGGSPSTAPLAEGPAPRHGVTGDPAPDRPGTTGAAGDPETLSGGRPEHPQSADEQAAAADTGAQTARRPAEDPSAPGASASPSPSAPAPSPTTPRPYVPAPNAPGVPAPSPREWTGGTLGTADDGAKETAPTQPAPDEAEDQALGGAAVVQSLGRDGTRHILALTVTEPLTALQTEFRLAPGTAVPGAGTAWTDLAGAVVTTHQERGAAVYRFSTPPGTDVRPGRYTFTVRGSRAAGHAARPAAGAPPRAAGRRGTPESWNAGAFGITRPRAVAALGGFTTPAPRGAVPVAPIAPTG